MEPKHLYAVTYKTEDGLHAVHLLREESHSSASAAALADMAATYPPGTRLWRVDHVDDAKLERGAVLHIWTS